MNDLKWMNWQVGIEMNNLNWMNWNEWVTWNEWIEIRDLTLMNCKEWSAKSAPNPAVFLRFFFRGSLVRKLPSCGRSSMASCLTIMSTTSSCQPHHHQVVRKCQRSRTLRVSSTGVWRRGSKQPPSCDCTTQIGPGISLHFFPLTMNFYKPCLFFEASAPARAGHYLVSNPI